MHTMKRSARPESPLQAPGTERSPRAQFRWDDPFLLEHQLTEDERKLRAVVPEPLEFNEHEPLVKYEFIRIPDSTGFWRLHGVWSSGSGFPSRP